MSVQIGTIENIAGDNAKPYTINISADGVINVKYIHGYATDTTVGTVQTKFPDHALEMLNEFITDDAVFDAYINYLDPAFCISEMIFDTGARMTLAKTNRQPFLRQMQDSKKGVLFGDSAVSKRCDKTGILPMFILCDRSNKVEKDDCFHGSRDLIPFHTIQKKMVDDGGGVLSFNMPTDTCQGLNRNLLSAG
eukprot:SAG11_NODE_719_length_7564_cov_14.939317_9_plen_193_part_00